MITGQRTTGKILIVNEDERESVDLISALNDEGFRPLIANNQDQAFSALKEHRPELVILNLSPALATPFCRRLKDQSESFIPVLQLVQRESANLDLLRDSEAPAESYLIQPVEPLSLLTTTRSLLRLKEASDSLDRANRAKTQFLANLSHEIRTPISAILGFTELLQARQDDRGRRDLGRRIRLNGNHLLRLIDDILNLSKFEVGKIQVRKESFSVTEIIDDVLKVVVPAADARGIRIHSRFALNGLSIIHSDPVRFKQIVTNLMTNAVKFSTGGKIDVRVLNQGMLVVEVEDYGIGMSEEEQQRIFKPFCQADLSIAKRFGGSGLGLALSKQIAQALGGDLELKSSAPGRGSCFRVSIDPGRVNERMIEKTGIVTDQERSKQLQNVRVLLVDDSSDNEELIRFYLQHDGANVEVAHNGYEAISKVETRPFDVVLMDVQMPEMDGLEATRRLRASGVKTPIIALTAHALREEVHRSLDAGCDAHLTKPIARKELVERIRGQLIESSVWMNAPQHLM